MAEHVAREPSLRDSLRVERLGFLRKLAADLTSIDIIEVRRRGEIFLGDHKMRGWKKALPFYAFNCEKHGIVVNYPLGHMESLLCPFCIEED